MYAGLYGRGIVPPCQTSQSSVAGTGASLGTTSGFCGQYLPGTIGPRVHFRHVADVAVPDDFAALAGARVGVSLIAHLRGHAEPGRGLLQLLRLPNGPRQRLLTIDVLPAIHGP